MDEGYSLPGTMTLILLLLLEAGFYGFGSAVQNLNTAALEKEAEQGSQKAQKLLKIQENPERLVYSVQVVTSAAGLVMGGFVLKCWYGTLERLLWMAFGPAGWILPVSVLASGLVLVICLAGLGIMVPRRCAQKKPEAWAFALLPAVSFCQTVLLPFVWLTAGISKGVLRLLRVDAGGQEDNVTAEDIMSMVNEGHEQGVLEASEAEMITNIFELDGKEASDIMTHRTNIVALDAQMPLKEAVSFILKEGKNSRYPVYEKDIDNIIGVLHMKDAMIWAENRGRSEEAIGQLPGLLREAHFIPESKDIDELFKEMQSQKIHMEIVVDEYGQTAGIVTMEDILEEIVGNILDEYDPDEESIVAAGDAYVIRGQAFLDDVADALHIDFTDEEYENSDTINGFLISRLNRIPEPGEQAQVEYQGYCFHILSVENKMIQFIRAVPVPGSAQGQKETEEKHETDGV